jgi:hypothetical protein
VPATWLGKDVDVVGLLFDAADTDGQGLDLWAVECCKQCWHEAAVEVDVRRSQKGSTAELGTGSPLVC